MSIFFTWLALKLREMFLSNLGFGCVCLVFQFLERELAALKQDSIIYGGFDFLNNHMECTITRF